MSPSLRRLLFLLACTSACTDRPHLHSELGHQLALHLCPVQDQCGCEEGIIDTMPIPNCEARVEQEFLATERRALAAGLEVDHACFADVLDDIDRIAPCNRAFLGPICPVYTAHAEVGDPCEDYDLFPRVSECGAGLSCIQGTCRDPDIQEGEICSVDQAEQPTGDLGRCGEGLVCDSEDTRTCVTSPYWPLVPTGGVCTSPISCVDESYCRPQDLEDDPSEERPGICTLRTPEGEACPLPYECTARCIDGICETRPPRMCDVLQAWWWARE